VKQERFRNVAMDHCETKSKQNLLWETKAEKILHFTKQWLGKNSSLAKYVVFSII
jgi:hypothetical protein